jgi:NADPH:quinone reductase-like Zn-dependent oxidoreductase
MSIHDPIPSPARSMRAMVLHRFGGADQLELAHVPVPTLGPDDVLVRLDIAGVGSWDTFEREGGYASVLPSEPRFPYILGSEGAGTVAAVGERVGRVAPGDRVYALSFLNPTGGFYAEYVCVPESGAWCLPASVDLAQAGVMGGAACTALRGLDDTLKLERGESLLVFGASGGVGHTAVQLARRMGARVFAVASGADGVALVEKLGADAVVNGHDRGVAAAARAFAPQGFDAALIAGSSPFTRELMDVVRRGGRVAYPNGIEPTPEPRSDIAVLPFNGEPDPELVRRLNACIAAGPFQAHIAQTFALEQAALAHEALQRHHVGKLALRIHD